MNDTATETEVVEKTDRNKRGRPRKQPVVYDKEVFVYKVILHKDNMTRLPIQVLQHEIPILEEYYGSDSVQLVAKARMEVPKGFSVESEYARLMARYGVKNENAAKLVYRTANDLAKALPGMRMSVSEKRTDRSELVFVRV